MIHCREDLPLANRIVIKAGTSVVSTPEGYPSLSRMAAIVEHAADLVRKGKEVLIVTSGAIGVGKQRLRKQGLLKRSMSDLLVQNISQKENNPSLDTPTGVPIENGQVSYSSACAAAGQLGLMSLYETMFNQYDITTSQLLVTAFDFTSPERRRNIQYVIAQLLSLGIVPLLNENDAVSANQGYQTFGNTFSDNDSLAALVSIEMSAQLLILLTDVPGVYDRPPNEPGAELIDIFTVNSSFKVGEKSLQGRGGMSAKVDAALNAIKGGVHAVVIAAGKDTHVIGQIMNKEKVGTLFLLHDGANPVIGSTSVVKETTSIEKGQSLEENAEQMAREARNSSRNLLALSTKEREDILYAIADAIASKESEILLVNAEDVAIAKANGLQGPSLKRLQLTSEKIQTLVTGIKAIAAQDEPIGKIIRKTELATDLVLQQITSPIGVLLIIFESRPDCLPQIAALALRSGNGILLKGGKEAEKSNKLLHEIICNAIEITSKGSVSRNVIGLVTSRASIPSLLKMDSYIDLVIPRGSGELVKHIKENTRIPVMGHAEGVCHIFIDSKADPNKAEKILLDSKTDYPSACNSVETLILHEETLSNGMADKLVRSLRAAGVSLLGSEKAMSKGLTEKAVTNFSTEYGDLAITIEIVSSVQEAIDHVHKYGSSHTECIVTEDTKTAEIFLKSVDSACVFHNASTRFADGFRFGLGAEVGISTGRIHARGPVGVEGLLTTKWELRSFSSQGHTVNSFAGANPQCIYTHKKIL